MKLGYDVLSVARFLETSLTEIKNVFDCSDLNVKGIKVNFHLKVHILSFSMNKKPWGYCVVPVVGHLKSDFKNIDALPPSEAEDTHLLDVEIELM